ncbi:TonB-dependent receptor plug domain-containing protein [Pontibacter harenae]|uniref:TonB-dependent receptor plug domain-containing protein n=1 Tax=Pontibacter harenae TaxID=2894083 RepID=UPI001E4823E4|nr:Plug domain-containing protein [Pontibacter harenae]
MLTTKLTRGDCKLSEVSVTANREKLLNTISAVYINLRPRQNSQEVLRMVPGLFIAQHAGGGKAEQIFLRGFDIDHGTDISLTVDGMPVNLISHAHGQGYSDLHFLIPETIEAVDFGKGPYRTDKGNFTTAGYASFHTMSALSESSVKLEAGRFDTYIAVGMFDLLGEAARHRLAETITPTASELSNLSAL